MEFAWNTVPHAAPEFKGLTLPRSSFEALKRREAVFADMMAKPEAGFDAMDPANISPLVVWLGSPDSQSVTGRVFEVQGGKISVADGWQPGPEVDRGARWDPTEVGPAIHRLLEQATPPAPVYGA